MTPAQRQKLFEIVLKDNKSALQKLSELFQKFQELKNITQRAVIARLLTSVAETLASNLDIKTPDGYPLLPDDLSYLNQTKIFEIVINNLLHRDSNVGELNATERLKFLTTLAVRLQRKGRDLFATPGEIHSVVTELFQSILARTDSPQQLQESMYRTCRRHSGLTTEKQFFDTSGMIDMPVDETDADARIGFSHNSLREYLVSAAIVDYVRSDHITSGLQEVVASDAICEFVWGVTEYDDMLISSLASKFKGEKDPRLREITFSMILWMIGRKGEKAGLLGTPPDLNSLDLCEVDLSGLNLGHADF